MPIDEHRLIAIGVFALTIVLAFGFSVLGRVRELKSHPRNVASQGLGRWLVGLSAGAAANSGFVVAGAVGLGFSAGLHWVMLPLAWFLGDLVFWGLFPRRINAFGQAMGANTVADLITANFASRPSRVIRAIIAVVVICCLGGYTAAQWLAGEKFVTGAFGLGPEVALVVFAAIIVAYTVIGGFRGSVYTDSYQAVLRLGATTLAGGARVAVARRAPEQTLHAIAAQGPQFLQAFPGMTLPAAVGFVAGYAAAALGFGLGQPQVLTRYMSAASPDEAQGAKWIYIGFVQYTWIVMTLFGVLLKGVMPGLKDGETGLAAFFSAYMPPVLTGVIIADIFATIAATSNSLMVAMAQTLRYDLMGARRDGRGSDLLIPTTVIGLGTMALSLVIAGNVVTIALASVSILGAGLAPSVMARILGWRHSPASILASIVVGAGAAIAWKVAGFDDAVNAAAPGIAAGLLVNYGVARLSARAPATATVQGGS
jgi:sodium/proline symporter